MRELAQLASILARLFCIYFPCVLRSLGKKIILTSVFDLCAPELITDPNGEKEQRRKREKESWNLEEEKRLCSA